MRERRESSVEERRRERERERGSLLDLDEL